jgi:DNA-damage-inducible protein D
MPERPDRPSKYWEALQRVSAESESPFDAGRTPCAQGGEDRWSARWLMEQLGYDTWENFSAVIERAKTSAHNQGHNARILFRAVTKKTGGRPQADFEVTRFAAYLIAMNGNSNKPQVSAAQEYFAVKTREAELGGDVDLSDPLAEIEAANARSMRAVEIAKRERAARIVAEVHVAELTEKIADDAPKVNYVQLYVADADLLKFRTVASANNVSEHWLRDLLVAREWIYVETESRFSERKGCKEIRRRYSAYAHKRQFFRPVEVHEAPRFKGEVMHTLKVTPAGAEAISRLIAKEVAA